MRACPRTRADADVAAVAHTPPAACAAGERHAARRPPRFFRMAVNRHAGRPKRSL